MLARRHTLATYTWHLTRSGMRSLMRLDRIPFRADMLLWARAGSNQTLAGCI